MAGNQSMESAISMILDMQKRLDRIENSPQVGNVSIQKGALQILDPLGRLVVSIGYQPDGSIGVGIYDPATEARIIALGQTPGELSLYALSVLNSSGVLQLVSGVESATEATLVSTLSTSWVDLGGPSVSVVIGPSGMAVATAVASTLVIDDVGSIGFAVDGALFAGSQPSTVAVSGGGSPVSVAAPNVVAQTLTGLTPGPHTISVLYLTVFGSASFQDRTLTVTPL